MGRIDCVTELASMYGDSIPDAKRFSLTASQLSR